MRIAILTYHRAFNCGAVLQAWAMHRFLAKQGHQAFFPSCCHAGEPEPFVLTFRTAYRGIKRLAWQFRQVLILICSLDIVAKIRWRHRNFLSRHLPQIECSYEDFERKFDLAIVGSDQVWRDDLAGDDFPLFLGECLPTDFSMIGYADSLGDHKLSNEKLERIAKAVSRYSAASVREPLACDSLKPFLGFDLPLEIDPSLLLDIDEYRCLEASSYPSGEYLLLYTILADKHIVDICHQLAARLHVKCIIVAACQYSRHLAPKGVVYGVTADYLLAYIKHAKYVVAESFHGTVFAMLYQKPFVSIRQKREKEVSRPLALLQGLNMEGHFATAEDSVDMILAKMNAGFPDNFYAHLKEKRRVSELWLLNALESSTRRGR